MGGKTAIGLGLVAGLVAGGLLVGGVIALAPSPGPASPPALPAGSEAPVASAPAPAASSGAPPSAPAPEQPSADPEQPSADPDPTKPSLAEAFGIGQPAPPLVLPLVGGETMDLAALRGKPVWVNFMATWCPPCQDELPLMAGLAARYEETGLVVLAVDVEEDEEQVEPFFSGMGIDLPVALDTDGSAQAAWGAVALPVHFWIDADGIVREGALGGIGPDVMAQGLQQILPGVTVTP